MITLHLVALVLVGLLAYAAGRGTSVRASSVGFAPGSRLVMMAVFFGTTALLWYVWGRWTPQPVVQDELAYVLQSELFARGRWSLPSPALPAFHEQPYVLMEPAVASKYFPGHSLILSIGAMVGWAPLMPLVLQGLAGVLIVVLVRRVTNVAIALLTWVIWLTSPMVLSFGPSYYSEATTIVCWLAGWYALLEWRTTRQRGWLIAVAVSTGWCVITRPLTGLAYALPVAVVVLRDVVHGRLWRDVAVAMGAGLLVLAIIPLWSARTTGDWRVTPLERYTRDYMPYDLPGFGLDSTPPARPLHPQFARLNEIFSAAHPDHVPSALPATLMLRARHLAQSVWGSSGGVFAALALLGLITLRGPPAFAVASSAMLLLVYLSFGTTPSWTLYYYESVPAYAYLTASGLAWMAAAVGGRRWRQTTMRADWRAPQWSAALLAGALLLSVIGSFSARRTRQRLARERVRLEQFASIRSMLPNERAVLFVRQSASHNPQETFVQNVADPEAAPLIVVHDLGDAENARLLARMPDRAAFLFAERNGELTRYAVRPAP